MWSIYWELHNDDERYKRRPKLNGETYPGYGLEYSI